MPEFDEAQALKLIHDLGEHFNEEKKKLHEIIKSRNNLVAILNDPELKDILCGDCKTKIFDACKVKSETNGFVKATKS